MPVMYLAGKAIEVPDDQVATALEQGYTPESAATHAARLTTEQREADFGGVKGKVAAGTAAIARGATLGLSDLAIDAVSGGANNLADLREVNPGVSLAGEVIGGLSPVGPASAAARLGHRIAETAEGASLGTRILRGAEGYGAEGGLQGLGQGVSEVTLSDDQLSAEQIVSVLSSNTLMGGTIGAGAGTLGKLAEGGLLRAKGALDEIAAGTRIGEDVAGDLGTLDHKGLTAAHNAEIENLVTAQAGERAAAAGEVGQYRAALKEANPWLVVNEGEAAAQLNSSSRQIRNALNDPKGLAKDPRAALKPLRVQEQALGTALAEREATLAKLETTNKKIARELGEEIATLPDAATHVELTGKAAKRYGAFADVRVPKDGLVKVAREDAEKFLGALQNGEVHGASKTALDNLGGLLEKNRALQAKIEGSLTPRAELTSDRIKAIADARDALSSGGKAATIGDRMASGAAYSGAAHLAAAIPVVGPFIAPFVGNAAASAVSGRLSGKLAKGIAETAERTSKHVTTFLDTAGPIARAAPVLATKVLGAVRYSDAKEPKAAPAKVRDQLAQNYHARSEELRSQTTYGPDGRAVMRPDARMKMATRLDPVRHISERLADRLETLQARRVEFLADKLPRRPDLVAMATGPDRWQPSDMEMRTFARYVAGVENPDGIEERLAAGSVTPEDAEVMREVYPERYASIVASIAARLPELRSTLPYQRRLALSVFSGVPVDPAMHPRILAVLQSSFTEEPGSEGGTQAPKPQPQFGSVKNQEATPSQQRQGATA